MLDLVVQAAEEPVGEDRAAHIARGQDLALQVAPAVAVRVGHLHALVVGGEGHSQVETEQRVQQQGEDDGLAGGQGGQQQGRVQREMRGHQHGRHGPLPRRLAAQVLEPVDLQRDAFEQQHREEQPGLVAGQPAGESFALRRLLLGPDQGADADVRVLVDVVGVGVVTYVLVVPPRLVHTEEQVAVHQADQPVGLTATGYLGVARVMGDERRPGPQDRQRKGQEQAPPCVAQQDERCDHPAQGHQIGRDAQRIAAGAPFKEALPLHGTQQRGEIAAGTGGPGPVRTAVTGGIRNGGCRLGHDVSGLWNICADLIERTDRRLATAMAPPPRSSWGRPPCPRVVLAAPTPPERRRSEAGHRREPHAATWGGVPSATPTH
ncbi:hypothetical protein SMICM17S_09175 [Streptomyces microflavus]